MPRRWACFLAVQSTACGEFLPLVILRQSAVTVPRWVLLAQPIYKYMYDTSDAVMFIMYHPIHSPPYLSHMIQVAS